MYVLFGTKWCHIFNGPLWSYCPISQLSESQQNTSTMHPTKVSCFVLWMLYLAVVLGLSEYSCYFWEKHSSRYSFWPFHYWPRNTGQHYYTESLLTARLYPIDSSVRRVGFFKPWCSLVDQGGRNRCCKRIVAVCKWRMVWRCRFKWWKVIPAVQNILWEEGEDE